MKYDKKLADSEKTRENLIEHNTQIEKEIPEAERLHEKLQGLKSEKGEIFKKMDLEVRNKTKSLREEKAALETPYAKL